MKTIKVLLFCWVLWPHAASAQPDFRELVLTGSELPALQGAALDAPVCYAYHQGNWQQCPLQIDERDMVYVGSAYRPEDASLFYGNLQLLFSRPRSYEPASYTPYVPFDADATFDGNDELVLMTRFFGDRAPAGELPPHATMPVLQVAFEGRFAYLFLPTVPHDQSAGVRLVNYDFNLLSGSFPETYDFEGSYVKDDIADGDILSVNPEYSTVSTAYYQTVLEDRWIQRVLQVTDGNGAFGPDLIDRVKYGSRPDMLGDDIGSCGRSDYSASAARGTLGIMKNGPLRALRFVQGYNSGPLTSGTYLFYEQHTEYRMDHRVHQTRGATLWFDYGPLAQGMTYYSNLMPQGVPVDGLPDRPTGDYYEEAYLTWDYLLGNQGSLISSWHVNSNIPNLFPASYYEDNTNPEARQCTGDAVVYAATGNVAVTGGLNTRDGLPWTDPRDDKSFVNGELRVLNLQRRLLHAAPGLTPSEAQPLVQRMLAPRSYSVLEISETTTMDFVPPAVGGTVEGSQFAGFASDNQPDDSGLGSIQLATDATNLVLSLSPSFTSGAPTASFTVTLLNPAADGAGDLLVTDQAGNVSSLPIVLTGIQQADSSAPYFTAGTVKRRSYTGNAADNRPFDTGIARIFLGAGAVNLTLSVSPFTPGAASVSFKANVTKRKEPGYGWVLAEDLNGNVGSLYVALNGAPATPRSAGPVLSSSSITSTAAVTLYPNPANPTTTFAIQSPEPGAYRLEVYNVMGQRVALVSEGTLHPGLHTLPFDGSTLPSGVYFYHLRLPTTRLTGRFTLLQ